jgi:hypothetical protein
MRRRAPTRGGSTQRSLASSQTECPCRFSTCDGSGQCTRDLGSAHSRWLSRQDLHLQSERRGRDGYGEDALLVLDGLEVPVQVVSMPSDQATWRELACRGAALRRGDADDAVQLVRDAFLKKRMGAKGTLLLLDASQLGAVLRSDLPARYWTKHGDPCEEFGLIDAWLVGPTCRSALCLGQAGQRSAV